MCLQFLYNSIDLKIIYDMLIPYFTISILYQQTFSLKKTLLIHILLHFIFYGLFLINIDKFIIYIVIMLLSLFIYLNLTLYSDKNRNINYYLIMIGLIICNKYLEYSITHILQTRNIFAFVLSSIIFLIKSFILKIETQEDIMRKDYYNHVILISALFSGYFKNMLIIWNTI